MTIRRAGLDDLDGLSELFNLYRVFYSQKSDLEGAHAFLKERLTNEESVIFIAFADEIPVGFAQVYPAFSSVSMKRTWILNDLFVKEAVRGHRFGEQLLNKVIDYAKETGTKGVLLETGEDNHVAQNLYEKVGFVREGNRFYFKKV